jgi:hypothetical protein
MQIFDTVAIDTYYMLLTQIKNPPQSYMIESWPIAALQVL